MEMEAVTIRDSTSEVVVVDNIDSLENTVDSGPVLRLRLKKPKPDRQVAWKEGTIDNEDMGKKKSKCELMNNDELLKIECVMVARLLKFRLLYL
ncbi:unnamed protein product [Ceratitis capitata]|uniref:E3 ubiquitin-protein ligase PPP1R11 n=1 Tax=Ceratitis capitata TaxID=7213 RepID=A0A811UFD0_CERCA|nr:unnamed protein product [Ceratitis capitata]